MASELFSSVFLLLLILDPLGNIPVVLSLLHDVPQARKPRVILRENMISAVILIVFVFIGDSLLKIMRLSHPALEIAGGIILFLIAMRMIFPPPPMFESEENRPASEPFIVPLAIPMIAGPSALATVLLASSQAGKMIVWIMAIVIACIINTLLLLSSDWFARLFGKQGIKALERLMGLILTAIAVQMLLSGIRIAFNLGPMPMT